MSFCVILRSPAHLVTSPSSTHTASFLLLFFSFLARLDGNAVTMLPGRSISLRTDTSAHFLSTVKIQCHVQSLFINRNEMLALRMQHERRAREWRRRMGEKWTNIKLRIISLAWWKMTTSPRWRGVYSGEMKDDIVIIKALFCLVFLDAFLRCIKVIFEISLASVLGQWNETFNSSTKARIVWAENLECFLSAVLKLPGDSLKVADSAESSLTRAGTV